MGRSPIPKRYHFSRRSLQPGSLSGISSGFPLLSPAWGQVSYVLRTRAPLSTDRNRLPVRLACVRHAANVHPEPGSNSPYDSLLCWLFFQSPATVQGLACLLLPSPLSCCSTAHPFCFLGYCSGYQTWLPLSTLFRNFAQTHLGYLG
jgi:hypothetical protein